MLKKYFLSIVLSIASFSLQATVILKEIDGQDISFPSLKGKWVLLNYWAGWCDACLEEIPELNRFFERNKSKNIVLYGVNFDSLPIEQQKKLFLQLNIRYPSLAKDPAAALGFNNIEGIPVTFIFDPNGNLNKILYGAQTVKELEKITNSIPAKIDSQ